MNPDILKGAETLIRIAQMNNAVVTISLEPQEPLAMGNYKMVADVRPARQRAATGFNLDAMCDAAMGRLTDAISADVKRHKRYMACSYFEVKRAMETRHRERLTKVKTLNPLKQLSDAIRKLNEAQERILRDNVARWSK